MKLLFILILFVPIIALSQVENPKWDFPVKPGSKEWLGIEDYSKRLELLNLPESIIKKITTEELVKTCLNYPEFRLIFTRNDLQSGYNYIRSKFNGFRELETRKDSGKELIKIYASYKPDNFDYTSSDLEIGLFIAKFTYIEILLAQTEILNKLSSSESSDLMVLCGQKYKQKKELQKYYGIIGLQTTALVTAKYRNEKLSNTKIKYGNQKVEAFLNRLILDDSSLIDDIMAENDKMLSDGL